MCRRFLIFFFVCVLGATKKTKKRFAATGHRTKKSFIGRFRWVTRLRSSKKIKSNRTLRPKGRSGFEFCRFRRFRAVGLKKSSCRSFPAQQRRGSGDSPSTLSVLARCSPRFRAHESPARLVAQRCSKRIWLHLYRVLCIVELTFRGLSRTISSKVQVCKLIVDEFEAGHDVLVDRVFVESAFRRFELRACFGRASLNVFKAVVRGIIKLNNEKHL